ncbi:MAG: thioesterase family protein [Pseudomonadota bacterium]
MPDHTFRHEIRVTWADCDPADIAYTGRIPYFALDSIDAWWEHHLGHGWFQMRKDLGLGTPFVHMDLDFRSPLTPRHRLICEVMPNRLGVSSVGFSVRGFQDGTLCFEGNFVSVFVAPPGLNKVSAPPEIEALIRPMLDASMEDA